MIILKNVYIDKLDDIVNKYNNTYHNTIKMKPVDVKSSTIEIPTMTVVVRAIFLENNKSYPQVFLDVCLYKLQII